MKLKSSRFLKILLIAVASIILLLAIGAKVLSGYAEKTVSEKLASANCNYETLDINIFSRSVHISGFAWMAASDSTQHIPHRVSLSSVSIQGIGVLDFLVNDELHISKIILSDGDVRYDRAVQQKSVFQKSDSGSNKLQKVQIDQLVLDKIKASITQDSISEFTATIALTLKGIEIESPFDSFRYQIKSVDALIEQFVMQRTTGLYRISADRLAVHSEEGKIEIDSLNMNPLKGKYEFANSLGRQKTRAILRIPRISLTGFSYEQLRDSIFSISEIQIENAYLSVFRDKRLRFNNPLIPLPMDMLKEIPFGLKLDSIKILNSKITHEEIAEEGSDIGKIDFDDLNASISNLNNRIYADRPNFATITATSKFLKTGAIEASFFLPVQKGVNYKAQGKILHLDLTEMNSITEPVGLLRIESGFMNQLNFTFQYNETKSNGKLDINYENLHMISLNKRGKKNDINQFKTFIINTLVKNDKDKSTPKAERTGIIDIDRDPRRFVVNVWTRSIFNGLKSAILPDTQEEKPKK